MSLKNSNGRTLSMSRNSDKNIGLYGVYRAYIAPFLKRENVIILSKEMEEKEQMKNSFLL